jgi:hypothetical protein
VTRRILDALVASALFSKKVHFFGAFLFTLLADRSRIDLSSNKQTTCTMEATMRNEEITNMLRTIYRSTIDEAIRTSGSTDQDDLTWKVENGLIIFSHICDVAEIVGCSVDDVALTFDLLVMAGAMKKDSDGFYLTAQGVR